MINVENKQYSTIDPLTKTNYDLNYSSYCLLKLCDGYSTWGEIIGKLANLYGIDTNEVIKYSEPLLEGFTDDGMLWWRRQRIQWADLPAPKTVLLDLTYNCNLFCRHCVVAAGTSTQEELSLEDYESLIDELAAFGVKSIVLTGGEPLIRHDFFDVSEYAYKLGLSLMLSTNGTLITDQIARKIASLRFDVQVSLDGSTPEVHDFFRRSPGAWEHAIQGIQHLLKYDVPVTMGAVITKINIDQIPSIYDLASDIGVQRFRIMPFVPYGRGRKSLDYEVPPKDMKKITEYLLQRRKEGGLTISPMEFECTFAPPPLDNVNTQTHIGCDGAISYCNITPTGDVLPCNFFAGVETENIKEHSFSWIWKNSRFLNYFRSLTISDLHGACLNCPWLPACRGSCLAANFAHRDIFQSNCHCWLVNPL